MGKETKKERQARANLGGAGKQEQQSATIIGGQERQKRKKQAKKTRMNQKSSESGGKRASRFARKNVFVFSRLSVCRCLCRSGRSTVSLFCSSFPPSFPRLACFRYYCGLACRLVDMYVRCMYRICVVIKYLRVFLGRGKETSNCQTEGERKRERDK